MISKNLIKQFKNGLVYTYKPPASTTRPTICFIPGFKSDFINSKKSNYFYDLSVEAGYGFLSWNHSNEESVYSWFQDGLELVKEYKVDYFIGASMGLWISLLLSFKEKNIRGIMGIGGGIDFTERWLNNEVPEKYRNDMDYVWKRPSQYEEKGYYEIPIRFLIDSRQALLVNKQDQLAGIQFPVYLIHGDHDQDLPGEKTLQFLSKSVKDVYYFPVEGGDHQLSRVEDLIFIKEKLQLLIKHTNQR